MLPVAMTRGPAQGPRCSRRDTQAPGPNARPASLCWIPLTLPRAAPGWQCGTVPDASASCLRGGEPSLLGPIFVREWLTVPRRTRHYVVRSAYLGLLWVLGLTAWQAMIGWSQAATLGDTARFGVRLF